MYLPFTSLLSKTWLGVSTKAAQSFNGGEMLPTTITNLSALLHPASNAVQSTIAIVQFSNFMRLAD